MPHICVSESGGHWFRYFFKPILGYCRLGTNVNDILIKLQNFSIKKMHLNISSAKWWPFCPGWGVDISLNLLSRYWQQTPRSSPTIGTNSMPLCVVCVSNLITVTVLLYAKSRHIRILVRVHSIASALTTHRIVIQSYDIGEYHSTFHNIYTTKIS